MEMTKLSYTYCTIHFTYNRINLCGCYTCIYLLYLEKQVYFIVFC